MSKVIMKYNPAFLSAQELVDSFVVRHAELDSIVGVVRENVTQSNQHILVVGPRGSGKTMLVLRASEEIRRDKELGEKWYPLVFSEESYRVSTCGEFWLESLFHLGQQTKDERWGRTYAELRDEQDENRLCERSLAQLMDFADKQGKRILLVVENFNMLVGDQLDDDNAWAMRHTLLNEPRVMLLATATSRFEQVQVEGKPMYELFRFIDLKPLDEGECKALWQSVTGSESDDGRIRPLQILTGGNPRLMVIVSSFAAKMSLRELMQDLMQLVDENTEYFKSHLDNLPSVERKVYLALAEIWDPATARQVAEASRENVNKTSSLLGRLMERGAVVEADGKGRAKLYQVAERMYNIYYLMRRRGAPSRRVRAVVNFMVSFYGPEELIVAARNIAEETCKLGPGKRSDHYAVYEEIVRNITDDELWTRIVKNTPTTFLQNADTPSSIKGVFKQKSRAHFEKVLERAEFLNPEELAKEEEYFRGFAQANPSNGEAWAHLGSFLAIYTERYEEAEMALREAVKIEPTNYKAWASLGFLLEGAFGRNEEAESAWKKVVEIAPEDAEGWSNLERLLAKMEKYKEAESTIRKAIDLQPEEANHWSNLGFILGKGLAQYEEAEDALRKAIELDPNSAARWSNLGLALEHQGKLEEAGGAFRRATHVEPDDAETWVQLAFYCLRMGRFEESRKCFIEAVKQDAKNYAFVYICITIMLLIRDASTREEGWRFLEDVVQALEPRQENIDSATGLFVGLAGAGYGRKALEVLRESAWAKVLAPVVVALQLMAGEDVKAAVEIMEVAKDVVKRIEERRKELEDAKSKKSGGK